MSFTGIGPLLLTSAALMGSPGPSTISITAVGAAFGFRRSLGYAFGLILGTCLVLFVVSAGVFAIFMSVPRLAPILTIASAVYIIYLAVRIACAPPLQQQNRAASVPSALAGFLLAAANPKAYVAIAAVLADSHLADLSPSTEVLVKTTLLALMIVLIHLCWLLAGASLFRILASRFVNIALAVILVITSVLAVLPK